MIKDEMIICDLCGAIEVKPIQAIPFGWTVIDASQHCIDVCPKCVTGVCPPCSN